MPKVIALFTAAYAFSPIDLIPDFIPVLGLIDDLLILPLGIALVIKLIPPHLMEEYIDKANYVKIKPVSYLAGVIIAFVWVAVALFAVLAIW